MCLYYKGLGSHSNTSGDLFLNTTSSFTEYSISLQNTSFVESSAVAPDSSELKCGHIMWQDFYYKYWIYIDASIYSLVPSTLLIIFNVLIIKYLFKASSESSMLNEEGKSFIKISSYRGATKGEICINYLTWYSLSIHVKITPKSRFSWKEWQIDCYYIEHGRERELKHHRSRDRLVPS